MRYCPNCGEDGEEVLECWECGVSKCEECAMPHEVTSQHCHECDSNLHISQLVRAVNRIDPLCLHYTVELTPHDALVWAHTCAAYNAFTNADLVQLVENITGHIPPIRFQPGNPNNGTPHHRFRVGNRGSRHLEVWVDPYYLEWMGPVARGAFKQTWKGVMAGYAKAAHADDHGVIETAEAATMLTYFFWWD